MTRGFAEKGAAWLALSIGLTAAHGCGEVFTSEPAAGGGGATTTSSSSSTTSSSSSTSGSTGTTVTGITVTGTTATTSSGGGGAGGAGGGGGDPLPCDVGFAFTVEPIQAGVEFIASYEHSAGYAYVFMWVEQIEGNGDPEAAWDGCDCNNGPVNIWRWRITGHGAGKLRFTFGNEDPALIERAHCAKYVAVP